MSQMGRKILVVLAVVALAVPAAAVADHGSSHGKGKGQGKGKAKGKGKGKTHNVAWVFKGLVTTTSPESGEVSVEVKGGNARVRKEKLGNFVGKTVTFKLEATTPIVVADFNGDTKQDLADVQVGDRVLVKCMLPKQDPGSEPFAAKRLVDQTHPPAS